MTAVLIPLLMVSSWAIYSHAEVDVQPGFDLQKFTGMWHIMACASNCRVFQSMKSTMTTSAALIKALPNGDMQMVIGYPYPEECKKMEMLYKKTDQPGHFTNNDHAKSDTRVLATDYHSYALLYTFKEVEGEPSSTTVQLYTREPSISPEVMMRFKDHYHKVGLADDMMAVLLKSDACFILLSS